MAMAVARPRRGRNLLGAVAACAVAALLGSPLSFAISPFGASEASPPSGSFVAASAAERLDVPRGEAEPRTRMHVRYATGERSRKNHQGGGRLPIGMNRRAALAYSFVAESYEATNSVVRRMWDMCDLDFNKMCAIRQRTMMADRVRKKWTMDYNFRLARKKKLRRLEDNLQAEWMQWMRTEGRRRGLTTPVPYAGPPLKHVFTKEMDEASEPEAFKKLLPSLEVARKWNYKVPLHKVMPDCMKPGMWPARDDPWNIFNLRRRPLCKYPYDIAKKGKSHIVHGTVIGSRER